MRTKQTINRFFSHVALALVLLSANGPVFAAVQSATGEVRETQDDYSELVAHPIPFSRHFRSTGNLAAGMGPGWSHNWAATAAKNTEFDAVVRFGVGRNVIFVRANAAAPWVSSDQRDRFVELSGGVIQYWRASDETLWTFTADGRLFTLAQRNGWTHTLAYNTAGMLQRVTNAFGRSIVLSYNAARQLQSVTFADNTSLGLSYDATGRLVAASSTDGTRQYFYEDSRNPAALTGVSAETGARYVSYAYDAAGRATSMQYAGTPSASTYTYSAPGSVSGSLVAGHAVDPSIYRMNTTVRDPLGNNNTLTWIGGDGNVRLLGSDKPLDSQIAQREFGVLNLPTTETDFLGVQTTHSWDTTRQLKISTTAAANRPEAQTVQTQWHPTFRLPVLITEQGRSTAYSYDGMGNKLSETVTDTQSGVARSQRWTYNAKGLAETMTDFRGGVWHYTYDAAGNRINTRDPLGRNTSATHDAAGRVLTLTEPGGLTTSYQYDARGRLVQQIRGGEMTRYTYTPAGQLQSVVEPNGYQVSYSYDAAQRLVAVQDNRGATIAYALDAAGNRIREEVRDAGGNLALATGRVINSLNQVAAVQGALGQTSQIGYDANGQPVSQTDPLNQTTRQTLDGLRRTTATTFADNTSATQAWNALGQLTQVADPKGVRTTYTTNAFGEVVAETSPDIGTIRYTRDAGGEVIRTEDAKGQIGRIERDALGRITAIEYAADHKAFFTYDAAGHVSRIEDQSGSTRYTRDPQGRILTKTQLVNDNPSNPSNFVLTYGYANGDLASIAYPSGLTVSYHRQAGRVTGITVQEPPQGKNKPGKTSAFVTDLSHTALGQPRAWRWASGDTAQRTFDADGRMTGNEFASYGYDAAGRITRITQQLWAQRTSPTGVIERFQTPIDWTAGYDNRDRLIRFSRAGAETTYTYDANSNRLSAQETQGSDVDLEGNFSDVGQGQSRNQTTTIGSDSNRLLGFTQTLTRTQNGQPVSSNSATVNYQVDANGAMTSDGLRDFGYDASGRLAKVSIMKDGEAASITYLHNALGQRVFKSEPRTEQTLPNEDDLGQGFINWLRQRFGWLFAQGNSAKTSLGEAFVYGDGSIPHWALIGSYDNGTAAGKGSFEFIWLPTEDDSAIPVGLARGGKLYAVHTDHLGTPRLITDNANQPVWQWPYGTFGDNKPTGMLQTITDSQGNSRLKATKPVVDSALRFPGQMEDPETGLFYNYFRSYDAKTGRYTQADPIGLVGGWNPYLYGDAKPLRNTDPLGLKAEPGDTSLYLPTKNCSCTEKCLKASHGDAYEACAVPAGWLGRLTKIPGASIPAAYICKKIYVQRTCEIMCRDFCAGKAECPTAFRD